MTKVRRLLKHTFGFPTYLTVHHPDDAEAIDPPAIYRSTELLGEGQRPDYGKFIPDMESRATIKRRATLE